MTEEALFHEVLAKPLAERAAFLDQACAAQPALRAAVEALLAAHEASGNLLDQPAAEDLPPPASTATYHPGIDAGAVIARRYTLVEKIGTGGMGEVWVAKQTEPIKRKVALKLIKPGMDSRAVIARFEQERQALALMDHPNIARVLDGGITDSSSPAAPQQPGCLGRGQPFFVMELVNGLPLTKFCDDAKLTPKERLELFVPICQAVQHAHQKGIVHRDLKPSNVLVTLYDGKPVPKIIDFGVAKATGGKLTDESLSTQFGAVVGTLEYMAPEQAGLSAIDIDTRADVYSLGVILYELLTGLRPLDGKRLRQAALDEVVRIIREEEPSKPSTRLSTDEALASLAALRQTEPKKLMAMLRGELDWVVMKCLEKDRSRRYETVNGLARDIQRYLADEPVEARPPSAGYRLKKFVRRNKGPVVAVAIVVLALVGGIIGTTWGLVAAEIARQAESEQREIAETREKDALNEKAKALAAADEERQAKQREVEQRAIAETRRQDAEAQRQRADEQKDLALRNEQEARKQQQIAEAVRMFLQRDLLLQANPIVQLETTRQTDVDLKMRTVLDRAAKGIGDKFRDQPLVEAAIRRTVGMAYEGLGLYATAQGHLEKSVRLFREHLGPNSPDTLDALEHLGELYHVQRKVDLAEAIFVECLQARQRLNGKKDRATLTTIVNLASAYLYRGKLSEAEQLLGPVLDGIEDAFMKVDDVAPAANILALTYRDQGKYEKAEVLFEKILKAAKRQWGEEHPYVLAVMNNLATVYSRRGKYTEAEDLFTKCLEGNRKQLTEDHPTTLWCMYRMAQMYERQGNLDRAEEFYRRALDGQVRILGADAQNTNRTLLELWDLYSLRKKHSQADELVKKHLDMLRNTAEADSIPYGQTLALFGVRLLQQQRPMDAAPILRECLAICEKTQPDAWTTFNTQSMLGGALLGQKKYADAEPLLLAGYEGMKQRAAKIPPSAKVRLTEAEGRLAELFEATRNKDETKLQGSLTDAKTDSVHEVKLTAGKPVVIEMQSKQFDTYLRLEDAKGKTLAENDDIDAAANNLNSRILFLPRDDGVYRVIATSFQQKGRGEYEIIVREYGPGKPK